MLMYFIFDQGYGGSCGEVAKSRVSRCKRFLFAFGSRPKSSHVTEGVDTEQHGALSIILCQLPRFLLEGEWLVVRHLLQLSLTFIIAR